MGMAFNEYVNLDELECSDVFELPVMRRLDWCKKYLFLVQFLISSHPLTSDKKKAFLYDNFLS